MLHEKRIIVCIAELVASRGASILVAPSLGSCIGLALYDRETKVGGLAHILLDYAASYRESGQALGKYADTAIPELIRRMVYLGASTERITAKIAGGGNMFGECIPAPIFDPGLRNAQAVSEMLRNIGIPLVAEDIGGYQYRTMEFALSSGEVVIKRWGEEDIIL
ncbi:MAG: chemotaxis protein CheD [Firmicutes bacterium]|nr:chemotaxis protein CheD [Bacillota bacterium]